MKKQKDTNYEQEHKKKNETKWQIRIQMVGKEMKKNGNEIDSPINKPWINWSQKPLKYATHFHRTKQLAYRMNNNDGTEYEE